MNSCIRGLVASQGVRGLWNGYTATLLRDVPFSALYWPLYEATRDGLQRYLAIRERRGWGSLGPDTSFMVTFVSGAVAGSVASTITLPFDVIKTIKQIEMGERDIMRVTAGHSRTNLTIARELIADQGPRSLFSGKDHQDNNICLWGCLEYLQGLTHVNDTLIIVFSYLFFTKPFTPFRTYSAVAKSCPCVCYHDF